MVCEDGGRWYLQGAVSFGRRNCPTTHYTVFARVASYVDWIQQVSGLIEILIKLHLMYTVNGPTHLLEARTPVIVNISNSYMLLANCLLAIVALIV